MCPPFQLCGVAAALFFRSSSPPAPILWKCLASREFFLCLILAEAGRGFSESWVDGRSSCSGNGAVELGGEQFSEAMMIFFPIPHPDSLGFSLGHYQVLIRYQGLVEKRSAFSHVQRTFRSTLMQRVIHFPTLLRVEATGPTRTLIFPL